MSGTLITVDLENLSDRGTEILLKYFSKILFRLVRGLKVTPRWGNRTEPLLALSRGWGACFNNEAMLTDCLRIPRERCVVARSAQVRSSLFSSGKNKNPRTYVLFNRGCASGTQSLPLGGCLWSNPPPCGISTIEFYALSFFPYRFHKWEVDMRIPVWFTYLLPFPLRKHTHTHRHTPLEKKSCQVNLGYCVS